MIGNLYSISKDYDKVKICKLAAIYNSEDPSLYELINVGYLMFYKDEPYKALDTFFKVSKHNHRYRHDASVGIGLVYMYLKNFR